MDGGWGETTPEPCPAINATCGCNRFLLYCLRPRRYGVREDLVA